VTYVHVELETHAVLLAENCPAESFLDENCRNQFQNAAEFHELWAGHIEVVAAPESRMRGITACVKTLVIDLVTVRLGFRDHRFHRLANP
jgi:hypothetical protein